MSPRAASLRFLLATVIATGACAVSTLAPIGDPGLALTARATGLLVENSAESAVWYALVPTRDLPLFDLYPCVEARCSSVPARSSAVVPWPAAPPSERTYGFFWWRSVSDGHGGQRADSVRMRTVAR